MAKRGTYVRCSVHGCRRKQEKLSSCCREHKLSIHDKPTQIKAPTVSVLTAVCAAVAAKYKDEGDKIKAGLVIACLSHDPPRYYASVVRYPDSPHHKQVVCKVGHAEEVPLDTADAAVLALAKKWAADNRPAPVQQTIETLDEVLK